MSITYVAGASAVASTAAASMSVTIPASAAANDIAVLVVNNHQATATLTVPAGWSMESGPDTASMSAWVLTKSLAATDPGSVVPLVFGGPNGRIAIGMGVYRGGTDVGLVSAVAVDATSGSTATVPSITGVPAGSAFVVAFARRYGGTPAPDVTLVSGYTNGTRVATTAGTTPEVSTEFQYKIVGSAGTYGGETATLAANVSVGVDYAIVIPPAVPPAPAPTANAGADQTNVEPFTTVSLFGNESSSGTVVSRAWTQTGGSPTVTLVGTGANVTFEAPGTLAGTTLTFTYTVTDDTPGTGTDTVTVAVLSAPERVMTSGSWTPAEVTEAPQGVAVPVVPGPPPPVPAPTDPFKQAIRNGLPTTYIVNAAIGDVPVAGATGLQPTGGSITDTTTPGGRRLLNLELAPAPGLFDLLSPIGTTLTVTAEVRYPSREVVSVPMGVFDIDRETLAEGGGTLSVTAPDKWVRIVRAKFLKPESAVKGTLVVDEIVRLIRGALGSAEPVNVTATSTAKVGAVVYEKDRDQEIIKHANGIGAWVFFDRNGVATVADIPTVGGVADWLVDASETGVLTSLDRERSRTSTCNIVVVTSSAAAGAAFPVQYVWDNDPKSPTYAGPGTGASATPPPAGSAGPFGQVPYFYDTPLPLTVNGARAAGRTVLARTVGLASQVSMGQVPNPALDAFDTLDVMPPRASSTAARVIERHVADQVTHPLAVGQAQQIQGRSTRSDPYASAA